MLPLGSPVCSHKLQKVSSVVDWKHMTTKLALVFESVSTLPARAQAEAAKLLIDVRQRHTAPIMLTPQQEAFVMDGIDACDRGAVVDHDELMRTLSADHG